MNFDQINEFKSSSLHSISTYLFVENAHEKHGDCVFAGTESGQLSYFIVPSFSSLNSNNNNDNFNNEEIPFCNEKRSQDDHGSEVTCLIHSKNKIISPNSDYGLLFSGSRDRTIKVWNINPTRGNRSLVQTLFGHVGAIVAIADSLDGSILTSSAEGNLRVWSPQKNRASMLNPLFDCVFNITINSSGFLALAVKPTVNNVNNSLWSCYIGDNSGNIDVFVKTSDESVTNTLIHKKQWKKIHDKKITHLHIVSERSYLISFSTDKSCKVSHTFSGQVMYSFQNPHKCNYSGALWNSHKSEIELIDELGFFEVFSTIHDSSMHSTQLLTPRSSEQHMVILSGSGKDSIFRSISQYKKDYFFTLNSPSTKADNKIVLWCNSVVILEKKSRNRVSSPPNERVASPISDIDDNIKEYINNYSESNFNSDSNGVSSPPSSPSIKVAVAKKSSSDLLSIDALMQLRSVRIGPRFSTEATRKAIGPTMSRANSSDGRGKSKERGIKSPEMPVWNRSNINSVSSNKYKTPLSDSKGNSLVNDSSNNDFSADLINQSNGNNSFVNISSNQQIFERIDENNDFKEEFEKSPFQQAPVAAPHEAQIIAALRNLPSNVRKIIENERQQLLDIIAGHSLSPSSRDNTNDYEQNRSLSHSMDRKNKGNSISSRDDIVNQKSPSNTITNSINNKSNVSLENNELKKILNPPQRFPVRKHAAKKQDNEERGRSRRVVEGINGQKPSMSSIFSVPTKLMKRLNRASSSQVANRNSVSHIANIKSTVTSQSPSRRVSSNETTRSKSGSVFSTFGGSGGNRDDWMLEVDRRNDLRSSSNSRSRSRERSISQQQGRKSIYNDGNTDTNNVIEKNNKNESGSIEMKEEPTPTSAAKWLSHKSFFDIYAGKKGVRSISPDKGAGFRLVHSPIDNDNSLANINDVVHAELNLFDEKSRIPRYVPESVQKSPFKTKSYYKNGSDFDGDISLINDDDILNDSRSSEYKGNNAVNRDIDLSDDAEWKRLCKWLHSIGMSKYSDAFRRDGAVKLSIMSLLQKNDLYRIGISSDDADYIVNCITDFTDKLGKMAEEVLMYSPFGTPISHKLRGKTSSFGNNLDMSIETHIQQNNNQQSFSPNSYKFASAQAFSNSKSNILFNQKNNVEIPYRNSQIPTPVRNNSKVPTLLESSKNINTSPTNNIANSPPENGLLSDLLLYYYDIGDVHNFFYYWDKKCVVVMSEDAQFFNPDGAKSSAIYNARKAIEFHLCLHFAVYPINHNMGSEIINERLAIYKKSIEDRFTRDKSTVLIYSREFALYAGLAIIPNPKMNPAFSKLFLPQWSSEFRTRFRYFIEIMNIDSGNSPRSQNLIHNHLTDDPTSMSPSHLLGSLRSNIFSNEATFGCITSSPNNQINEAIQQIKNEALIIPSSISTSKQMEVKIETVPSSVNETDKKAFILAAISKNTKGKKLAFSSRFAAHSNSKSSSSIVSETTIKLENNDIVKVKEVKLEDLESNLNDIHTKDLDVEILPKVSMATSLFPNVDLDTEIIKYSDVYNRKSLNNEVNNNDNNDNNDSSNLERDAEKIEKVDSSIELSSQDKELIK